MNAAKSALITALATELHIAVNQIERIVCLLEIGKSVPFIAYSQQEKFNLRVLQIIRDRIHAYQSLQEKKFDLLKKLKEEQCLTAELEANIQQADSIQRLDDLYLPYRRARRTRAVIAKEADLAPLAHLLCTDFSSTPHDAAMLFIATHTEQKDVNTALAGV